MATRKIKEMPPVEEMETQFIDLDEMEEINNMNYKDMDIKDIVEWCVANNQVEWLKDIKNTKVPYTQYPRKKGEPRRDKDTGAILVNKKGETLYKYVADKSAEPKIVYKKPSFMHIKNEFCKKFMPELMPTKKDKEPNMWDLIDSL